MKSGFLKHGGRFIGLAALLFTSATFAQTVDPTWVKDGVDWQQYKKFLVKPLEVDDVRVIKPAYAQDDPTEWTIELQDLQALQAIFRDVMKDVLSGNDGYPVVYSPGPDVLEVELELLSITPWLKPGSDSTVDGHQVKTLGSGEVTGRATLRDSQTRELLLMIEGDKAVGEKYTEFTLENNVANLNTMFTKFATRLRNSMDEVHGK